MDEPLSNLDAKLRVQMRAEIAKLQHELGTTTIYVTHDQVEAMTMGDRVAVMSKGVLQQVDTPQRLYDEPANLFVAGFIGTPPMNLFRGSVRVDNGSRRSRRRRARRAARRRDLRRDIRRIRAMAGRTVVVGDALARTCTRPPPARSCPPSRPGRAARGARLGRHGVLPRRCRAGRGRGVRRTARSTRRSPRTRRIAKPNLIAPVPARGST